MVLMVVTLPVACQGDRQFDVADPPPTSPHEFYEMRT
jgi:hypothetical protein